MPNFYEAFDVQGDEFSNYGAFVTLEQAEQMARNADAPAIMEVFQPNDSSLFWVIADSEELEASPMFQDDAVEVVEQENPNKKYIVLYVKGGRVGSFPYTSDASDALRKEGAQLLQRDVSGTENWNLFRPMSKALVSKLTSIYGTGVPHANPFNFSACIRRARRKGVTDTGAYCATVDRRMQGNPLGPSKPIIHGFDVRVNRSKLDQAYEAAVKTGKKLATEKGRHVRLMDWDGTQYVHAGTVQPDGTWDLTTSNAYKNPSLRERASETWKDLKHAVTKRSASKQALKRLQEAAVPVSAPVRKFGLGKKRNPEGEAEALYEEFHGRPAGEVVEVEYEEHEHETLTGLGDLCQLKIITPFKKDCVINVCPTKSPKDLPDPSQLSRDERIILSCSEDGKQLYFIGGDQSVDVEALGFGEDDIKDSMLLGVLYEVTYQAEKGFDKFQLTNYYHKLGEDTGVEPVLIYDPVSQLLKVSGGQYKVEAPGIIN